MKFDVTLSRESIAKLRKFSTECPRTIRAAFGAAAKRALKRFRKVMRSAGGVYGVAKMAPHHEISNVLRPGQQMGGLLADPAYIVMYKVDPETQYIGWPDKLAKWAEKFQSADTHAFSQDYRQWLHRKGVRVVPETYQRPERDVVASFASNLAGDFSDMVLAMFDKYYNSRMAKYGRAS